jgi:hypothetical protein
MGCALVICTYCDVSSDGDAMKLSWDLARDYEDLRSPHVPEADQHTIPPVCRRSFR